MRSLCSSIKRCVLPALIFAALLYALPGVVASASAESLGSDNIQYLGMATFDHHLTFEDDQAIGGLSGLTYLGQHYYLAISDDRSRFAPARYYRMYIDLHNGRLAQTDVHFSQSTPLRRADGQLYAWGQIDPEGIAYHPQNGVFIASEGDNLRALAPHIDQYNLNGQWQKRLPLPDYFIPARQQGVRNNRALESLALTPDGQFLFTATEQALIQDGPESDATHPSPTRIVMIDLESAQVIHQYLYMTDPKGHGLVDLIALSETRLLTLERNYVPGQGNSIRLYHTQLEQASDLQGIASQKSLVPAPTPAHKTRLVDLHDLGITPDNIEGMALGPRLSEHWQALILVSDNNFSRTQKTQVIGLAIHSSVLDLPPIPKAQTQINSSH